ncbi:hypothetical protein G6F41_012281 [Rhizopus arrhizus]|nr:hypothetical protein G6F41_012281 [Rhizopus arrhizus]
MDRSDVIKIVPYVYQRVCQGVPVWPQGPVFTKERKQIVDETFLPLKNRIPTRVTLTTLSGSPNSFVPCLLNILSEYEIEHNNHKAYDVRRLPLPRLFSLSPTPGMHWRFVNISANALAPFIKETLPQGYQNQLNMFYRVFNFKKLRLSMDDLTPNENNKILFGNTIKSDGFSVDFVFYRKERMALITVYSKKLELKKECSGIKTIESQIPTPKTAAVGSYDQYVKYTLTHLDKLLDFYGKDTAHRRF